MDLLNALVALSNFVIIPAIAYGSQLALGALGLAFRRRSDRPSSTDWRPGQDSNPRPAA